MRGARVTRLLLGIAWSLALVLPVYGQTLAPHFADEVQAAGLAGKPFTWTDDGKLSFGESLTTSERNQITALVAAHNPADVVKIAAFKAKLAQGNLDGQKMLKALAIWTAGKLGISEAQARQEILTIYRGLP